MRIAGRRVEADGLIEVRYPWNDAVVGTVPAGDARHAREAFAIAGRLPAEADALRAPAHPPADRGNCSTGQKDTLSDLITLELGISKLDSLYEVGRAFGRLHARWPALHP